MSNLFDIPADKLKKLLSGYETWLKTDPKEEKYPRVEKEKSKTIKEEFLNLNVLPHMSDDELYDKIYRYSRKLEGPVAIRLGEPRLRSDLPEIRRNLMYIMTSKETPFEIAGNILEGEFKIEVFAKAFWSPILLAQFPNVLPNWNNKTEKFFKRFNVSLSTSKLSVAEKYKIISDTFIMLAGLSDGHDFYTINHLMHYGTVITEGMKLVDEITGKSSDPVLEMISNYKKRIRRSRLIDEIYKWELLQKYRGRPDLNAPDFASEIKSIDFKNLMYPVALAVRNHLADELPEEYKACLARLFNEDEDLNLRVRNFMADMHVVFRKVNSKHFHQHDERTISTLLTYHNPNTYTFYKAAFYQEYCKLIGVDPKPRGEKYAHYLELVTDFVDTYVVPDAELIALVKGFMNSDCFADENHLILVQDILFQMLDKKVEEDDEEEQDFDPEEEFVSAPVPMKKKFHLNAILYGPPGTGKTYGTIDVSLKIMGENVLGSERTTVKMKFSDYQKSNRIYFTNFHQNLAYEDFIEGIKPVEPEDEDDFLKYEIQDGLFMRACVEATFNYIRANFGKDKVVEKVLDFNSLFDRLVDQISSSGSSRFSTKSGGKVHATVTSQGNISIKHDGRVKPYTVSRDRLARIYEKYPNPAEIANITDTFRNTIGGSNSTAYWSVLNQIAILAKNNQVKQYVKTPESKEIPYQDKRKVVKDFWEKKEYHVLSEDLSEPYVFIIDEINRGNVAQIFGELITLIEEDKRLGKEETLYAELPYSKHPFAVPPNLYIIGTMNTADRSVEALDSALRRRFSFIEKNPDPEQLGLVDDIDLSAMLRILNKRLSVLKDSDHTIGHAWLMNIQHLEELKEVFGNKILPLLKEYFYNDYEKLGLVLGDTFFKVQEQIDSTIFASFTGGSDLAGQYGQSWNYELKPAEELTGEDFKSLLGS